MSDEAGIDVYLGLDVGKGEHHRTALTPAGKKVFDKPLPNSELFPTCLAGGPAGVTDR